MFGFSHIFLAFLYILSWDHLIMQVLVNLATSGINRLHHRVSCIDSRGLEGLRESG
jgi:hypothetical protein